ncbi:DUF6056 family protein [Butyrivibrio sp. JL13D10]|uniref:DUF3329 domain-containing protein n=1 Tax=Butyrivibrio sp. JL13D10 TaxID=3236815 RepID=UPI0038B499E7
MIKEENTRKKLFFISVILCFITILIYEILTPMLMDDMSYGKQVQQASSFFELFAQEHHQYMTWTGRSVAHLMLRIIMYVDMHTFGGRVFFNIIAAVLFTVLSLLVYLNANNNVRYDVSTYWMGLLLIWIFGVSFGQTVLWETGACNYLFTTTIVMTMVTIFRSGYRKNNNSSFSAINVALLFVLGVLAGWCNENTSGGLLLLMIITAVYYRKVYAWSVSAMAGTFVGLLFMVLAPGNGERSQYLEEAHAGLLGMAARFLKITLVLKKEFVVLLIVIAILFIFLTLKGYGIKSLKNMILFLFIFFATSYSLILTVTPQERAFFGAGIFLIIAIIQGFCRIDMKDADVDPDKAADKKVNEEQAVLYKTIRYGTVIALGIYMIFTYIESGANLARIYREEQNRYNYLEEQAALGAEDVEIPMLDEQFYTRYSSAYLCDVSDDWTDWNNQMIAEYYGFKTVLGVKNNE